MRKSLGLLMVLFCMAITAHANTFSVSFLNGSDQFGDPPYTLVGSGTFSFTDNLGDGAYYLNTLTDFNIDFTVGSSTFTNADIDTDLNHVIVSIYNSGSQFYFDNDPGYTGNVAGGSLDFLKIDDSILSFEPNGFGPPPLDLFGAVDSTGANYFGVYQTGPGVAAVPEPSTLLLLGSGLIGAAALLRRKLLP